MDGFYIEAFSCQLHMGPADSAKPEEDARLQTAAANPSPPPGRKSPSAPSKSPSPDSASGTTQSASPADQNPLEPAEDSRNPGASPSKPSDPNNQQDLADAISNDPSVERLGNSHQPFAANPVPNYSSVLRGQGSSARSAGYGSGQGLSSGGPASGGQKSLPPASTQKKKGLCDMNASGGLPNGQQCSPPAIKVEFDGDLAQQAQHANKVLVKTEQSESDAQGETLGEEAGHHRQEHWQKAPQTQHAQHARQPADFARPHSTAGYAFSSQTPSHAQRLSAADAEAQLFFMPHSSVPLPAAAVLAPNSGGFVPHSSPAFALPQRASSLQQQHWQAQQHQHQQQYHRQQQLQQQQWLAQQHYHQQMLMHQQQQPMGVSREQPFMALKPGQTVRIVQGQKHLPVLGMASAQHAGQLAASQPPPSASHQHSNGVSGPAHDSFGSQHAKHGANGFSNHQQGARGRLPQQEGQHAKHGANGFSHPSVHSKDPQRMTGPSSSGNGTSTAFIIWCDGQYKARGQVEKRAALRNFVQAAKVHSPFFSPSSSSCRCSSFYVPAQGRVCWALNKLGGHIPVSNPAAVCCLTWQQGCRPLTQG